MTLRPYWHFYKNCIPFILGTSFLFSVLSGWIFGILLFLSISFIIGIRAVLLLRPNEIYFYYNAGITKKMLIKKAFFINCFAAIPVLFFFILINYLIGIL